MFSDGYTLGIYFANQLKKDKNFNKVKVRCCSQKGCGLPAYGGQDYEIPRSLSERSEDPDQRESEF